MATQLAGRPAYPSTFGGDILRQALVLVATLATIVVNGLANALPINSLTTGAISDRFQVFFVPAGYVFSIWGVIYLGLLAFTVYQALPGQREQAVQRRIGPLYLLSALANMGWIVLWHYEQFWATVPVMLVLLASLIAIYRTLAGTRLSTPGRILVGLPFSIYLGWISVATVANVTAALEFSRWGGWGLSAVAWFWVMLAVATVLGAAFAWLRRDVAYVAVLVWAFVGIAAKHADVAPVAWTSYAAAALLIVVLAVAWLPRRTTA